MECSVAAASGDKRHRSSLAALASNLLIDTWIVDRLTHIPDGGMVLMPFGLRPVDQFIFTADGHFAFSMMGRMIGDDRGTAGPYRDIVPD